MTKLGCIKLVLFLILELQVSAASNRASVLKKHGDPVTLSCRNVLDGQQNCDGTTWLFSGLQNREIVALVTYGEINEEAKPRMSVAKDCSLVLRNLTVQDVGRYDCQQYTSGKQLGHERFVSESVVDLSVIKLTEQKENQKVTLSCTVVKFGPCKHKVAWVLNNKDVDKEQLKISDSFCSDSITFPESVYNQTSANKLPQCCVFDIFTDKVERFGFTLQSSVQKTVFPGLWRVILVPVGLGALLIIVVSVNIWTRMKENKGQKVNPSLQNDDADEGAVRYENVEESSVSVTLHSLMTSK